MKNGPKMPTVNDPNAYVTEHKVSVQITKIKKQ